MIKLIIFDAHGVIFKGGYVATARALSRRLSIPYERVYEVMYTKYVNRAALREITQTEAWTRTIQDLSLPLTIKELRNLHYSLLSVNKPILHCAKRLKNKYRIIILTKNMRSQWADTRVLFPEVWKVFGSKNMINTWEYRLPKAKSETMYFLCQRFRVKPEEMLYIDDQEANLKEPKRMGARTILYKNVGDAIARIYKVCGG
ncbi:MAG: hypothetical protein HYY51_00415 [Candidatus Magasanikbacteria bacterium]|nr:hypothetical protein [Candidatus Magasanikbacteria bacterium]